MVWWHRPGSGSGSLDAHVRKGTWALHTRPGNGAYQDVLPGKFGESVRLPEPLGIEIGTGGLPTYGDSPA